VGRTLRTSLVAFLLPVLLLSAGCGGGTAKPTGKALRGVPIREVRPAGDFTLTDHHGETLQVQDLHGKVVALFFGYTHCPDICPLTMSVMSQAATTLGKDAEQVRFLFVTVDPERDSVDVLSTYVARWDQVNVTGLTGSQEQLAPVYAEYNVAIEKVPKQNGGYAVNHSAQTWLIDQKGMIRAYLPMGASGEDLANDIRYLLKNP
jgi:protein SCO1/2